MAEKVLKHDVFGDDGDIRLQLTHPEAFRGLCGEKVVLRSGSRLGDEPDPLPGAGSVCHGG
jgi:hypothetical protein